MSSTPQNYYEAKGYLWMKLMNQVKPGWTAYQQKAIEAAAKLSADPKKNITKYMGIIQPEMIKYLENALTIYSDYITKLCSSWAIHALRNEGINQTTMDMITQHFASLAAPVKNKGKGKGAGKGKGKK